MRKLVTHERRLHVLFAVLAATTLLLCGWWMRLPILHYTGPSNQEDFNRYVFDKFAYSDIASLYFRDRLLHHPLPYVDYPLEYPPGTGLIIYFLSSAAQDMPQYFLLTSLFMGLSALITVELVSRFPRGRVRLFALSPALALYFNLNWDMWAVLLMIAALLLFVRERDGLAALVLAAATWSKFFPAVLLPFVFLDRMQRQGWRAAGKVVGVFTLASVALNAPLVVLKPSAWWHFFEYNASREGDLNLWTSVFGLPPSAVSELNALSAVFTLAGIGALLVLQWRGPPGAWLTACPAAVAWFFFAGKVYSPQYGLWIVVLLAVVGASPALAVAWSATDLAYFAASFVTLGLLAYGDAGGWFVEHGLKPAAVLREGMLLVVVGWCAWQMRRSLATETAQTDTGTED
jgi:hypothetical protein